MTPDGIFPGYPQPKGDPFDPEKAKKLLVEAGYKDSAGNYDPKKTGQNANIALDRVDYWISKGAQPSDTVRSIIKKAKKATAKTA